MYKKSTIKPEHRRIRDVKRSDRGDHTTRRVSQSPHVVGDSEFQVENLDSYLVGNSFGSYMRQVHGTVGGTGDNSKLMAKKQEEAAMRKMAVARLMVQADPQYGVRLSEKNLKKIEAKMLRDVQPLDINKRRMLFQMYTFRKPEDKSSVIKEEALTVPGSLEMESEIEEPFESHTVRANEGVQTDISCSNSTNAETATSPSQIPAVMAKESLQETPTDISNTPSQRNQSETANLPSQKPIQISKETLQKAGISTPSVKKLAIDVRKCPPVVGSQPSPKISVDTVKAPSLKKAEAAIVPQRSPVDVARETWQRKQAEIPTKPATPVDIEKEQRKQTQVGYQSVIQAYIANTSSPQAKPSAQKTLTDMTNQYTTTQRTQPHGPFQKQVNLPKSPPRRRYPRQKHEAPYSPVPQKKAEMAHPPAHTRQTKQVDKSHSPQRKKLDTPQYSSLVRKPVKSPKKHNLLLAPSHKKYTPISTQKSSPTNHKRNPVIKTLTITQRGHSAKIYKAVSFVEQKKASLKINMDHKSVSRAASSSRSRKSKRLSTSQESSSIHSPKRVEKDDSPNEKENSPSSIAKLVMNRRNKNKRRKRARSPDMEEASPLQTEVAKWAPQSVNEHTKPYYEAWVNTTLTAVSSDNEHVRKEKERIMEMMRERLESCLLSEEELSDEKYTGRIKVVTHR